MKLCFIGCWIGAEDPDGYKEYGAYILDNVAGESVLRGFGASSKGLPYLALEIKALTKKYPIEGIALRYEPPGTDIVVCWGDGSITLSSADREFRALTPVEIAQFREEFLKVP